MDTIVNWCAELLSGHAEFDDPRWPPLQWLGGRHAAHLVAGGNLVERAQDHWPRVWAARALLYVWPRGDIAAAGETRRGPALRRNASGAGGAGRDVAAPGGNVGGDMRGGIVGAVVAALKDPAWRVREMAAKVVRKRELGQAGEVLAAMVQDEVTRVRLAAVRALAMVGEAEHAAAIRSTLDDPQSEVRHAAVSAIETLSDRLEREL